MSRVTKFRSGSMRCRRLVGKIGLGVLSAAALAGGPAGAKWKNPELAKYPTKAVDTTGLHVTDNHVYVGDLHSLTGTMAISEIGSVEAEKLAITQINAKGGILGRKIVIVQEDGASDWPTFAEKCKLLLAEDHSAAIFGCWTSASRKAVLPVLDRYNGLLYYPTFYEGLEENKHVFYTGQEATQQILWGLKWAYNVKHCRTFYLIGSDYIWPRTSNKIARIDIQRHMKGARVVGEQYYPLGYTDFQSAINRIKLAHPDCIFSVIVGGSNVAWFKQLHSAGITGPALARMHRILLTISTTEDEIRGIGGKNVAGFYSSMKYFQSLKNPANLRFVAAFKKMWGPKSVIGDVTQAAYLGPWLWKKAVEKAGSFDVKKVVKASPGIWFHNAPEGPVRICKDHHLLTKSLMGEMLSDGQFKVVAKSKKYIHPNPFPKGYMHLK